MVVLMVLPLYVRCIVYYVDGEKGDLSNYGESVPSAFASIKACVERPWRTPVTRAPFVENAIMHRLNDDFFDHRKLFLQALQGDWEAGNGEHSKKTLRKQISPKLLLLLPVRSFVSQRCIFPVCICFCFKLIMFVAELAPFFVDYNGKSCTL